MNSYPDFGIYPEDLDYCAEILEKIFKKETARKRIFATLGND